MNLRLSIVVAALIFSGIQSAKAANHKKCEELYAKYEECYYKGDYSGSISYLEQILPNIHSDSIFWFSDTYNGLVYAYFRLGRYEKAVDYGQKALECDYQIGDSARISTSLALISSVFAHQRQYANAEHYIRVAVDYVPAGNSVMLARRYSNLGEILSVQEKNDEAIYYIQQSYKLDSIDNRIDIMAVRLSQLGSAYLQNGEHQKADVILAEASEKLKEIGNVSSLCINLIMQTKNYIALGRKADAEKVAAECLELAGQIGQRKSKLDAMRYLAMIRNSPQLYQQTLVLNDSLYNEQISQQVADFEVRYATAEKEKEIAQQQVTIERQQNALIVLAVVLISIFVALVLVFIIRRMRRDIEHTEKMARELFVSGKQSAPAEKTATEPETKAKPDDAAEQNIKQPDDSQPIAGSPAVETEPESPAVQLSPREIEIVSACCQGKLSKEIADEFGISKKTVDNYKSAIYQKLGVCNNTELILYAVKHGIVKL